MSAQVAVRYARSTYDPTNEPANMVWHFARAAFDWRHGLAVHFLEPTSKQPNETPSAFAGRVRHQIADALAVPLTNHSHDDQRLQRRARRCYKRPPPGPDALAWAMPEVRTCKQRLGLDFDACAAVAEVYVKRAEASTLAVDSVEAYQKALGVSAADAAALWALRTGPLSFRELLVAEAMRRCSS